MVRSKHRFHLFYLFIAAVLANKKVQVYYYVHPDWTNKMDTSNQSCLTHTNETIECEWLYHDNQSFFKSVLPMVSNMKRNDKSTVTVAMFNIHTLWEKFRLKYPNSCEWPTNLTMATSEESDHRFHHIFNASFHNFDGYSTTHPSSSVQRIYDAAYMEGFHEQPYVVNTTLLPAASYIAHVCHAHGHRERVVVKLRQAGIRVDGLGKCSKTTAPAGIVLHHAPQNNTLNALYKRTVTSQYMFNLAFENSIEDGYVTEKPFDALMAGTVPIYLGDSKHLKRLLPHPKAAIFVDDYSDINGLADYLKYLISNQTAFFEHRHAWRINFSLSSYVATHSILATTWHCQVCQWATNAIGTRRQINGHSAKIC